MRRVSVQLLMSVIAMLYFSLPTICAAADNAGLPNLAQQAKVTVSSEYDGNNAADHAVDGKVIAHGSGEWASQGEKAPWIKLEWPNEVTIGRVVLYDRLNFADNASGGVLTFSDGSTLDVQNIDPDGQPTEISFEGRKVTSLTFQLGGVGSNVGLAEIEVFEPEIVAAAEPVDSTELVAVPDATATEVTSAEEVNPSSIYRKYAYGFMAGTVIFAGLGLIAPGKRRAHDNE